MTDSVTPSVSLDNVSVQEYEKKPETVQAYLLSEANVNEAAIWCGGRVNVTNLTPNVNADTVVTTLDVPTIDGVIRVPMGSIIARSVNTGLFQVWDPNKFNTQYQVVAK